MQFLRVKYIVELEHDRGEQESQTNRLKLLRDEEFNLNKEQHLV